MISVRKFPIRARSGAGERGDTIVEVLIATAIVSLVLASAYALTNRNVAAIQRAQEQQYAQKLVEQQIELLRADTSPPSGDGCYDPSDGTYVQPASNSICQPKSGGATYNISVSNVSGSDYVVRATWEALGGETARVTIYYRIAS